MEIAGFRTRPDEHRLQKLAALEKPVRKAVEPNPVRQPQPLQRKIAALQRADHAAPERDLALQMNFRSRDLKILRVNPGSAGHLVDKAVGEALAA